MKEDAEGFRSEDSDETVLRAIQEMMLSDGDRISLSLLLAASELTFYRLRSRFGILEYWLKDPEIHEIMINGPDHIFLETDSGIHRSRIIFNSTEELEEIIRSIAANVRREINERNPILDARLSDGSRVNAVLQNVAHNGPVLTIRKFSKKWIKMADMISSGAANRECALFLKEVISQGCNIFISGGTSSGKTTFLNALTEYIPENERVVIIEDSQEIQPFSIRNIVQMECHTMNMLGQGKIGLEELIRTSLRMRPDRIIVGEVRGKEAIDMLQAMNTGHDGMSTGHANSVAGMLRRLEAMCIQNEGTPLQAAAMQIVEGLDIMIHMTRFSDGRRRVTEIQELTGYKDGEYLLNPLFLYDSKNGLYRTKNHLKSVKFMK
ncbi:MAG: ATPase, T2SS/T4P/T4SS family [Eubacteriales bacterium]|nr:ATPase, T2SS/T4P/T4SS family [Eubacteriales bacterium]